MSSNKRLERLPRTEMHGGRVLAMARLKTFATK